MFVLFIVFFFFACFFFPFFCVCSDCLLVCLTVDCLRWLWCSRFRIPCLLVLIRFLSVPCFTFILLCIFCFESVASPSGRLGSFNAFFFSFSLSTYLLYFVSPSFLYFFAPLPLLSDPLFGYLRFLFSDPVFVLTDPFLSLCTFPLFIFLYFWYSDFFPCSVRPFDFFSFYIYQFLFFVCHYFFLGLPGSLFFLLSCLFLFVCLPEICSRGFNPFLFLSPFVSFLFSLSLHLFFLPKAASVVSLVDFNPFFYLSFYIQICARI